MEGRNNKQMDLRNNNEDWNMTPAPRKYTMGKLMRMRRQQLGISQKELAAKVGLSDSAISLYEADQVDQVEKIRDDLLEKLAQALQLDVNDLLHPGQLVRAAVSEASAGFVEEVRAQHEHALRAAAERCHASLFSACMERRLSVDDLNVIDSLITSLSAKRA